MPGLWTLLCAPGLWFLLCVPGLWTHPECPVFGHSSACPGYGLSSACPVSELSSACPISGAPCVPGLWSLLCVPGLWTLLSVHGLWSLLSVHGLTDLRCARAFRFECVIRAEIAPSVLCLCGITHFRKPRQTTQTTCFHTEPRKTAPKTFWGLGAILACRGGDSPMMSLTDLRCARVLRFGCVIRAEIAPSVRCLCGITHVRKPRQTT